MKEYKADLKELEEIFIRHGYKGKELEEALNGYKPINFDKHFERTPKPEPDVKHKPEIKKSTYSILPVFLGGRGW